MIQNNQPLVEISRVFQVSRELMFSAWTQPEMIKRWLHPGPDWSNPFMELDLAVGGQYRLGFSHPEEAGIHVVGGSFVEIVLLERLVYTWTWEPPHDDAGIETLVTILFSDSNDGTLVKLTHERFPDKRLCDMHKDGWIETLGCLDSLVDSGINQERE